MNKQREAQNKRLLSMLEDQKISEKLSTCKSPEECYEVAKEYVPDIPFAEFLDSMTFIRTQLEEKKAGFLDADDLENAAGGLSKTTIVILTSPGAASASASAV